MEEENHQSFTMKEFVQVVDKFLSFNEFKVLDGKGEISKESADRKALAEYREFNKTQPIESDFAEITRLIEFDNKEEYERYLHEEMKT